VRLVVGLGNPGERYTRTRHNVAWWVLEELAARHAVTAEERNDTGRARRVDLGQRSVVLLQPLLFMNRSGESLAAWREEHGRESDLLVLCDDVYLPVGALRLRASGSSGGHRGLESIESVVGGRDYARLRIGVGAAGSGDQLKEHVLQEFTSEETPAIERTVRLAADAVECWVSEGALGAMNQFNRRLRQEETNQ
jgi:PTH1 family peptidyl-tRNA hydrolase